MLFLGCQCSLAQESPTKQNKEGATKTKKDAEKKKNASTLLPPIVNVVVSGKLDVKTEGGKTESYKEQDTFLERLLKFSVTDLLLAAFTFALVIFTAKQAGRLRETIEQMRTSEQRQLRAYVTVKHVIPIPEVKPDSGEVITWALSVVWQNTGQTPTRNMQSWAEVRLFEPDVPKNFDFPMPPDTVEGREGGVIGPHGELSSGHVRINPEDLVKAFKKIGKLYLWADFEYNDVFEGTPRRTAEHCIEVAFIWDPFDPERVKGKQTPFNWIGYHKHNANT
jgi:hypothetical protein